MRFVAVSMPVNPPDQTVRLTKAQLYKGLVLKARDPTRVIPVLSAAKVLIEHTTGLLREIHFRDQPEPAHEKVAFFPPGQVTFTMTSPKSGEQIAHITNLISTAPDDTLILTYTFAFGRNGPLDIGEAAEKREKELEDLGLEILVRTLNVTRELVQSGEIY